MSLKTWILGGAVCVECVHYSPASFSRTDPMPLSPICRARRGHKSYHTGQISPVDARNHNTCGHCYLFTPKDTEP